MAVSGKYFGFKPAGEIWILYCYMTRSKNHVGNNQGRQWESIVHSWICIDEIETFNIVFKYIYLKEKKNRKM